MQKLYKKYIKVDITTFENPIEGYRVALVNNLAFFTVILCLSLTIILTIQGLFPQNIYTFLGALFITSIPILNHNKHYLLGKNLYLTYSVLVLILSSYSGYNSHRFNDIESIMVGFIATAIFLYTGKKQYVIAGIIYLLLIGLKVLKESYESNEYGLDFFLSLQNTSILCLLILAFSIVFRKSLQRAYEKIQEQDQRLYSLIDNVPLYMAMVDKERRYTMVNNNYVVAFGKPREQIIGSKIDDILPANILKTHSSLVDQALAGEAPEFLAETLMPDGSTFYATGRYLPIKDEKEVVNFATVYVADVTKLEEAKNELKKANKTKDHLFSIIAHDILSPLNLFQSILNVAGDGTITKEQFFHYQDAVKAQLIVLRETISGLLDWARIQLDGINAMPSEIDIDKLMRENLVLYQPMVDQKGIIFEIKTKETLRAWMDENHFKVVVRNLVHNALKYTGKDGVVSVDAFDEKDFVVLNIVDSGTGMNPELVNSILKKEIQHSEPGTRDEMGTGIGLSLCLGLLEKNNCRLEINSGKEMGTSYTIRIPKFKQEESKISIAT
jgi:PAS domain S-box-containing protein